MKHNQNKNGFAPLLVLILLLVLGSAGYYGYQKYLRPVKVGLCPAIARVCPDGSSVGPTGPNCEFAECPGEENSSPSTSSGHMDVSMWKTYRNEKYGFEFEYPAYFIKQPDTTEQLQGWFQAKNGGIGFDILKRKLDPKNIQGPFGKVSDFQVVRVGVQNGYQFGVADAGCGGYFVHTMLRNIILQIKFTACEDIDGTSINRDKDLMNNILSTFKFIK